MIERTKAKPGFRFIWRNLNLEVMFGRSLWKETYTGPQKPYEGEAPEYRHWVVQNHGWKILRGEGYVLSREVWRILLGKGYIHVRRKPFILTWAYYNREVDIHLRWR